MGWKWDAWKWTCKSLKTLLQDTSDIKQGIADMSDALKRLEKEVAETKASSRKIIDKLNNVSKQIRELKDDPAALERLADELDAVQSEEDAAVAAAPEDVPVEGPAE